jgi:hypothetical protein
MSTLAILVRRHLLDFDFGSALLTSSQAVVRRQTANLAAIVPARRQGTEALAENLCDAHPVVDPRRPALPQRRQV